MIRKYGTAVLFVAMLLLPAGGLCGMDPHFGPLLERLAADGVPEAELQRLFSDPDALFDPDSMGKKMRVLYRRKYVPATPAPQTDASGRKREKIPLHAPHLTPEVLERLAVFRTEHAEVLKAASRRYSVPESLILAILIVETKLGDFLGHGKALSVLASMAASTDYSFIEPYLREHAPSLEQIQWAEERMGRTSNWAYRELLALIEYSRKNQLNPAAMPSSIYGAIGLCQFLPSNALRLGVDGDEDGRVDLFSPVDAIHSVARFMHKAGWKNKLSRKDKIKVVKRYNPDHFYAITVLAVAEKL